MSRVGTKNNITQPDPQNKYSEKSTNKYEKFCPADLPQSLCQMKLRGTHER